MKDKGGVYEAKGSVCRFQMIDKFADDNIETSGFMSNSECASLRSCANGGIQDSCRTRAQRTGFVLAVPRGFKNEIDSAKAIGSMEVGVTCEEPNVLELEEYTEELFNVFDSVSGTRIGPELLKASRQVELDCDRGHGQRTGTFLLFRQSVWT